MRRRVSDYQALVVNFVGRRALRSLSDEERRRFREWLLMLRKQGKSTVGFSFILESKLGIHRKVTHVVEIFIKGLVSRLNSTTYDAVIEMMQMISEKMMIGSKAVEGYFYFRGRSQKTNNILARVVTDVSLKKSLQKYVRSKRDLKNFKSQAERGNFNTLFSRTESWEPFWFITTLEACEITLNKADQDGIATTMRDKLGLYKLRNIKRELVLISYGPIKERLFKPTFFDAEGYPVFRPSDDKYWGATLDLMTFADGFPEAIHKKVKLGKNARCDMWLGKPKEIAIDWPQLEDSYEQRILAIP